ncbi:MAG TPA: hypothetical protein VM093_09940 [Aeromicrobium sp.]|nr:hypothetical protein [Aeromicrobium sp.]
MRPSEEPDLTALLAASRNDDAGAVTSIWRSLTPGQQEGVLFTLLGMQTAADAEVVPVEADERSDLPMDGSADTAAMAPLEQTELIPKIVDDLRGLTGSESDDGEALPEAPAIPDALTEYGSRWRRRWKWSVLMAGWAAATISAFTSDVSSFGPMEWIVTVAGGGLLGGTLANFAIAAITRRTPVPTTNG